MAGLAASGNLEGSCRTEEVEALSRVESLSSRGQGQGVHVLGEVPRGCLKSRNSAPARPDTPICCCTYGGQMGLCDGGTIKRRRAIVLRTIIRRVRQRPSALPD